MSTMRKHAAALLTTGLLLVAGIVAAGLALAGFGQLWALVFVGCALGGLALGGVTLRRVISEVSHSARQNATAQRRLLHEQEARLEQLGMELSGARERNKKAAALGNRAIKEIAAVRKQARDLSTKLEATATGISAEAENVRRHQEVLTAHTRRLKSHAESTTALTDRLDKQRELSNRAIKESAALAKQVSAIKKAARTRNMQQLLSIGLLARHAGLDLTQVCTRDEALDAVRHYLGNKAGALAVPFAIAYDVLPKLTLTETRRLFSASRAMGAQDLALRASRRAAQLSSKDSDALMVRRMHTELQLYTAGSSLMTPPVEAEPLDELNRDTVLHVVGKSLPYTQSGYTVRTMSTVLAQKEVGISPVVAVQAGVECVVEETSTEDVSGIDHHFLGGPARVDVPWDVWMQANVDSLAEVVRRVRPAVIHAHSDFINPLFAQVVGDAFDIPVVYEQRGFWEESWWSRNSAGNRGRALELMPKPVAYEQRRISEAKARAAAAHVFTLAEVMEKHILEENTDLGLRVPPVTQIPNAVAPDEFTLESRNDDLAADLGLTGPVVGYISSMVHYEGIDILINGFRVLLAATRTVRDLTSADTSPEQRRDLIDALSSGMESRLRAFQLGVCDWSEVAEATLDAAMKLADGPDPHLLLVGKGAAADALRKTVEDEPQIIFTGQVLHEQVKDYYSLIDLFVIPRRPDRVCELVTPLKPFEAMAMSRAMLMSDVAALREIADASGAAETFRAGDPVDLARVMTTLVADSDQRHTLSIRGRDWVTKNRTWHANAVRYAQVYERLGLESGLSVSAAAHLELLNQGIDPIHVANEIASQPSPSPNGWFQITAKEPEPALADKVRTIGWRAPGVGYVKFTPGMDWDAACAENRTAAFNLHGWKLLDPVMAMYAVRRDEESMDWMLAVAHDWDRHVSSGAKQDSMAWYDMAISMRMPRLARLIVFAAQSGRKNAAISLLPLALKHLPKISDESAFSGHNNHGFYTAAAQLDFAALLAPLPGTDETRRQGTDRMRQVLTIQFASDGGHLEHSPAYHTMLLRSLIHVMRQGLLEDPEMIERINRAQEVARWMTLPDGRLAQFGDTDYEVSRAGVFDDPKGDFLFSKGRQGAPDSEETLLLPDSGYAFVRSPQPQRPEEIGSEGYLALMGAFHSRTHKHADDLTIVWSDLGHEILVDAGRFGYLDQLPAKSPDRLQGFFYSRPERQLVERTISHNTVSVDGLDHERRKRQPYGSGVKSCRKTSEGVFEISAEAPHLEHVHRRRLEYRPGESLMIDDHIDVTGSCEQATAWFNMNGELDLTVEDDVVRITLPGTGVLLVTSNGQLVPPVRGQNDPLRGWRSRVDRKLEPTWSFGYKVSLSAVTNIHTRFRIMRGH